jgi:uncharacterized protein (TIGR02271 family)
MSDPFPASPADDQPLRIPVVAEVLHVSKQVVETSRLRIVKDVETTEQTVVTPVMREQYEVERIPIGRYVDEAPPVRCEGETMIVSVLEEEVVVQKRLRLVEEIRLTKRRTDTEVSQPVSLRRETIRVERHPANSTDAPSIL